MSGLGRRGHWTHESGAGAHRRLVTIWAREQNDSWNNSFDDEFRLRSDGEPWTVALAEKLKNFVPDGVILVRTVRYDSQANLAERARTLEEQVKAMRLDFEHRTGSALRADSYL